MPALELSDALEAHLDLDLQDSEQSQEGSVFLKIEMTKDEFDISFSHGFFGTNVGYEQRSQLLLVLARLVADPVEAVSRDE